MRTWDGGRVALWNVAATEERAGWPGAAQLQRFPRDVRRAMERGAGVAEDATGCEVRFVTDAPRVRVTVTSPDADGEAYALRGDYVHSTHRLPAGVTRSITLERPTQKAFRQAQFVGASPWSPEVWRVRFGRSSVLLHGVEALDGSEVRPPKPGEETPALRWLAYGSSITHAHGLHGYPFHAARHLGGDVLNLGLSGSCLMEPAVADHIAARDDWDVATFEVGVNMRDTFSEEEFARRSRHLVEAATARGDRRVFLLTQFPNSVTYNPESPIYARCRAYDDTLRALAAEFAARNVGLIEGADVLTPLSGLSCDLVHPSEYGHADMGANLARLLRAAGV
jgi:hypothetical protein